MGTYLVTGAASGIGAATAADLRSQGHAVIGVDRDAGPEPASPDQGCTIIADLSTADGRRSALDELAVVLGGAALDGAVFAAGLGPTRGAEDTIAAVNVLGVTELLTRIRPALAAAGNAKVVVFGSNSTTSTPMVSARTVRRLIRGDLDAAVKQIRRRGAASAAIAYAASKTAVTWWSRQQAVRPEWAGAGIRINVIAPGPVMTPLLRSQLDGAQGRNVRSFPLPIREYGTPEQISAWVQMMLSPAADFLCGSVITVDGGTEALLRGTDWPRPLPLRKMPMLLWRMRQAPKQGMVATY